MYRLTTTVFNLGVLGYSHDLHFGLHSRGRQACGRGQLATFHGSYPNQDWWQGVLVWGIYSLSPGVSQSFVTIRSCNHLMRIISTYVDNTKKSEIS